MRHAILHLISDGTTMFSFNAKYTDAYNMYLIFIKECAKLLVGNVIVIH